MKRIKFLFTFGFYLWLTAVVVLTSMSFEEGPEKFSESNFRWDYLNHFFMYFIIPVLYYLSQMGKNEKSIRKNLILVFIGICFAIVTEVYQLWISGRSFNPVDLMLNLGGFLTGTGIVWLREVRINNKDKETAMR